MHSSLLAHSHGYLDLKAWAGALDWLMLVEAPVIRLRFDDVARSYIIIYELLNSGVPCLTIY